MLLGIERKSLVDDLMFPTMSQLNLVIIRWLISNTFNQQIK